MVISQPPGNNPFILLSCFTNAASIALDALRHLMFYTCNYNIRVTHRNGAYTYFTRIRSTEGSFFSRLLLYSFLMLHALALHLAVKILLQIFLYEDLTLPPLHLSVVFSQPRMPADRTCYATNTIKQPSPTFDINHQQKTQGGQTRLK